MRFLANVFLLFSTLLLLADNLPLSIFALAKFTDKCTDPFLMWEGAYFLVAKCPGKEEKVSVFWLRDCVTNMDGKMVPWKKCVALFFYFFSSIFFSLVVGLGDRC